jgi:hypothetical protein
LRLHRSGSRPSPNAERDPEALASTTADANGTFRR